MNDNDSTAVKPIDETVIQPPSPAIDPQHHANLKTFLTVLERFSIVALTLAPAVAAPFVRNPQTAAILQAEAPLAQALAGTLEGTGQ